MSSACATGQVESVQLLMEYTGASSIKPWDMVDFNCAAIRGQMDVMRPLSRSQGGCKKLAEEPPKSQVYK